MSYSTTPIPVARLGSSVKTVSAGAYNSAALHHDGRVSTWGNNSFGQIGNGTYASSKTPVPVSGMSGVVAASLGTGYAMVLKGDGTVYGFGLNFAGQLGNGKLNGSNVPVQAVGVNGYGTLNLGKSMSY